MASQAPFAPILHLPVELHLQIYKHCLLSGDITIASRPAASPKEQQEHEHIPGLTPGYVPVTALGFDRQLLESGPSIYASARSSNNPTERCSPSRFGRPRPSHSEKSTEDDDPPRFVHSKARASVQVPSRYLNPTMPNLHLTCRHIHNTLLASRCLDALSKSKSRNLNLYLSYPDGVCIAIHQFPHLLKMARSVQVAGICDLTNLEDPPHRARNGHFDIPDSRSGTTPSVAPVSELETRQVNALETLVDAVLGRTAMKAAEGALDAAEQAMEAGRALVSPTGSESSNESVSDDDANSPASSSFSSSDERSGLGLQTSFPTIDPPPATTPNSVTSPTVSTLSTLTLRIFHPTPLDGPTSSAPVRDSTSQATTARPARSTLRQANGSSSSSWSTTATPHERTPSATAMLADPYSLLWSHSLSPATAALACIYGGDIKLSVARGPKGNGIEVIAQGNAGRGRCVSCHWPRLNLNETDHGGVGWLVPERWGAENDEGDEFWDIGL